MDFDEKLLLCLLIVLFTYVLMILVRKAYSDALKRGFIGEFQIDISKESIVKKRTDTDGNYFVINLPKWRYSRVDGTKDKRRNGNGVLWGECKLYINDYILITRKPMEMINYVKILRSKGFTINMNDIERQKYNNFKNKNDRNRKVKDIKTLIEQFASAPTDFESYCAELYRNMGYEAIVTSSTNDGGFDIVISKDGETGIVECKCYSTENGIGRPLIQKLVGANTAVNADEMIFITTSYFTKEAQQFADVAGVKTINGNDLIELLSDCGMINSRNNEIKEKDWWINSYDLKPLIPSDIYEMYFSGVTINHM